MNGLLSNKVAAITGGGSGIGRAIAMAFAEQGAKIAVIDKNSEYLADLTKEFAAKAYDLLCVCGDVCSTADVKQFVESIDTKFGRLDTLVNNVGDFLGQIKPLAAMSDEDIDDLFAVNLRQVMIVSREAIPLMRKTAQRNTESSDVIDGGSIISISSIEGYRGMPNITPYGAYKLGLEGFTKSLALELAPDRIRVNAIAPETTETNQVQPRQWISEEDYARPNHWVPLGRFGRPEDHAGCALFLASPLAQWVTGTVIHADGGALAAAGWYLTPHGAWTNTPIVDRSAIAGLMPEDQ